MKKRLRLTWLRWRLLRHKFVKNLKTLKRRLSRWRLRRFLNLPMMLKTSYMTHKRTYLFDIKKANKIFDQSPREEEEVWIFSSKNYGLQSPREGLKSIFNRYGSKLNQFCLRQQNQKGEQKLQITICRGDCNKIVSRKIEKLIQPTIFWNSKRPRMIRLPINEVSCWYSMHSISYKRYTLPKDSKQWL